jgi:hypothetical protein
MVAAGIGFAFMPEHSATHPGAIHRPLVEPLVEWTVALTAEPGRSHRPAVVRFVRAARPIAGSADAPYAFRGSSCSASVAQ